MTKNESIFRLDFIGIGATKSGTTWLANCLRLHPEICLSEPKEIRFFNLFSGLEYHRRMTHEDRSAFVDKPLRGMKWYANHFRHCSPGKIKGEFSPIYLFDERVPLLIYEYFPKAKLIACLRNPIDRAYSHYWMYWGSRSEKRTFEESILKKNIYVEMGFYAHQLKRYLKYFGKDQILVLFSEDMLANPQMELEKVLRFLNVKKDVKIDALRVSSNPARKTRSKLIGNGVHFMSRLLINLRLSPLLDVARKMGAHRLFRTLNTVNVEYPKMKPSTREHLRTVFKDDIKELGVLLNRSLSHWQ